MAGSRSLREAREQALGREVMSQGSRKNKLAFWRERRVGRCKAPRRRRCSDIVEERQRNRCPPAAAPRRVAAPQHGKPGDISPQIGCAKHNVRVAPEAATKCQVIFARALSQRSINRFLDTASGNLGTHNGSIPSLRMAR